MIGDGRPVGGTALKSIGLLMRLPFFPFILIYSMAALLIEQFFSVLLSPIRIIQAIFQSSEYLMQEVTDDLLMRHRDSHGKVSNRYFTQLSLLRYWLIGGGSAPW